MIHRWLKKHHGNPERCSGCNSKGFIEKGGSWSIHWALKQGKEYAKNIDHFLGLCRKCHYLYDLTPDRLQSLKSTMIKIRTNQGWNIHNNK